MLQSAETRTLGVRARPDLHISSLQNGADRVWVVKDPLTMNFVSLKDEEYRVLRMLDGRVSLRQIKERLERDFYPARVDLETVQRFLAGLHREGLLVVDAYRQDRVLEDRRRQRRRRAWFTGGANVLALRFPGVNPAPLLDRLYPFVRWAFTRGALAAGIGLICVSLLLLFAQADVLARELPTLIEFFSPSNLLLLALVLVVAKGLHELAHGLTCRHFGGTCHELGLMLLVFTPCLYCNVSDAWMFRSKWQRIAVSLAGIYVELLLAALFAILWWLSEPGLLHWVSLNMMFVCCVSTILINGNPLLPYDGYYALSDLVGVPNLRQQAQQVVEQATSRFVWGVEVYSPRQLPRGRRLGLASYWLASAAYRWFLLIVILWFVNRLLWAHGAQTVARLVTGVVVAGAISAVTWSVWNMSENARRRGASRRRAACVTAAVAVLLLGILFIPLPTHVSAPALLWPADAQDVYVTVPGTLADCVPAGEGVQPGRKLARLTNRELEQEVAMLAARRDRQRLHVRHLELRRFDDSVANDELPAAREVLANLDELHARRSDDVARLVVESPAGGVVLPPPHRPQKSPVPEQLRAWSGSPLDDENRGAFLEKATLLCHVGDPSRLEAVLAIDEAARRRIRRGQTVRIDIATWGHDPLSGTVTEIAETGRSVRMPEVPAGIEPLLAEVVARNPSAKTVYFARVALDDFNDPLACGSVGQARIQISRRSLAGRFFETVSRTFRFPW